MLRTLAAIALVLLGAPGQEPAPGGAGANPWIGRGNRCLDREDPVGAWQAFQAGLAVGPVGLDGVLGLGKTHLLLGRSAFAGRYADEALAENSGSAEAHALRIRALIRARAFDAAVRAAAQALLAVDAPSAELLAARASALFRVQETELASSGYQLVLELDAANEEAHMRLGSGLLAPTTVVVGETLRAAVAAQRRGDQAAAVRLLTALVAGEPGNPVAHRLLAESLVAERWQTGMASTDTAYAALRAALPKADVRGVPVADFVRGYAGLSPARREVVDRAVLLFGKHLSRLIALGASHTLLDELERTTDAPVRRSLRGRRTFDGRVWDDVRGIGGMQAATGIEALDEAAQFGFDTLAHEIAHQVHIYAMSRVQKARITELYKEAIAANRCIDYYAASNEAEYFAQGVEAFASLGKRPGGETTHGHTRFELYRVDPALHDFVQGVVDVDPLADPLRRELLLRDAVAVALRCGRPEDACVAACWLADGPDRARLIAAAKAALGAATSR